MNSFNPIKKEKILSSVRVKNKDPAPVQITVKQFTIEAYDRRERPRRANREMIDQDELRDLQLEEHKKFEGLVQRHQMDMSLYVRYAGYEERQLDLERARSIYERALAANYRSSRVWKNYLDFEIRNKNVNRAQNLYERVVRLLPRSHVLV